MSLVEIPKTVLRNPLGGSRKPSAEWARGSLPTESYHLPDGTWFFRRSDGNWRVTTAEEIIDVCGDCTVDQVKVFAEVEQGIRPNHPYWLGDYCISVPDIDEDVCLALGEESDWEIFGKRYKGPLHPCIVEALFLKAYYERFPENVPQDTQTAAEKTYLAPQTIKKAEASMDPLNIATDNLDSYSQGVRIGAAGSSVTTALELASSKAPDELSRLMKEYPAVFELLTPVLLKMVLEHSPEGVVPANVRDEISKNLDAAVTYVGVKHGEFVMDLLTTGALPMLMAFSDKEAK